VGHRRRIGAVIRRLPFLLALVIAAVVSPAQAAQAQLSRLEGAVVDSSNQPVIGATVTLRDSVGGVLRIAVTDARGRFVVDDLPAGRYVVAMDRAAGPSSTIAVADGLPAHVTVRVPPAFRDGLVVDASQPILPVASRTAIGGASIALVPARTRPRLQDAVATLPGWATEDNGLLHSRGVDDGFLYVVDGVPVYERVDQLSGLAPDAGTIDALTVITGYLPPEFGYKAGGVIDVRTRAAAGAWRGLASMSGGSDAAVDGDGSSGGAIGDGATLWLQASGLRSHRFLDPVDPDNLHNHGGAARTAGQITAGSGVRDRLVASWQAGRARFDVPNSRGQHDAGQDARQAMAQGALAATWQRTWAGTVSQLGGYARRSRAQLEPGLDDTPLRADSDRSLTRAGLLVGLSRQTGRHLWKAGVEAQQLRLRERFGFAVTDPDAGDDAGLSDAALPFDATSPFVFTGAARPWLFAAYVQDTWQPTAAVTVAAGVRVDRTRLLLARTQVSPRLGAAVALSPRTTLRASVSRFYQPPQPEHLLLASSPEARALSPFAEDGRGEGGAEIEPERQWAFDGGLEHRFGRGWRLDVAGWQRRVREYADPNVFFGTTIIFPNAVASGRARGVDARLEVGSAGGPWSGYANVSVGSVTQTGPITGGLFLEDDVADIGPGVTFVPDHDQRVVASGAVTWTGRRGATLSAAVRHESGTPLELDDDEEAADLAARPGAELIDLSRGRVRPRTLVSIVGSVALWETSRVQLSLRGSVANLFGARYAYNFGNPFSGTHFGAPRTATAGVRIESR
jgi:outer membrane receptor protein involved in Fe transport